MVDVVTRVRRVELREIVCDICDDDALPARRRGVSDQQTAPDAWRAMAGAVDGDDANAVSVPVLQGRGELGAFSPKAEFGPPTVDSVRGNRLLCGLIEAHAGSDRVALDHNIARDDPGSTHVGEAADLDSHGVEIGLYMGRERQGMHVRRAAVARWHAQCHGGLGGGRAHRIDGKVSRDVRRSEPCLVDRTYGDAHDFGVAET